MDFRATWMHPLDPGGPRAARFLGAAIGGSGACAASYGAFWAGHSQSLVLSASVALVAGAGLGALTWGLFRDDSESPAWWFVTLYGGVLGMLAGAFAAFPLGAVFGAGGGALGGLASSWVWRLLRGNALGLRALMSLFSGSALGLLVALGMAA
mgnify:CR=1 FL=1